MSFHSRVRNRTHGKSLTTKDDETFGAHRHEARKLVTEDPLSLICLLDLDAQSDRVDRRLDQYALGFRTRNDQWVQQDFGRCPEWTC